MRIKFVLIFYPFVAEVIPGATEVDRSDGAFIWAASKCFRTGNATVELS